MKKIIALILVYILLLDLTSCESYTYISSKQDYETYEKKGHVYALDLITNRDSVVQFSQVLPGKLSNSEVKGPRQILLHSFKPDSVIFHKNRPEIRYVMKNNIKYNVRYEDSSAWVYSTSDTIRIPFCRLSKFTSRK